MNGPTITALLPAMILSCAALVEVFFRLPFLERAETVTGGAVRALGVVRSPLISDHWKEKVLPRYAGRILGASLALGALLGICAVAFMAVWLAAAWWPAGGLDGATRALGRGDVQLWLLGLGIAWALVRARLGRASRSESDYSAASQLFHRVALGSEGMRSLADDIDVRLAGDRANRPDLERPVYVVSLARAGTTVLLEALYGSGQFASLTYRAMPFVMAPWAWGAVSPPRRDKPADRKERAHGDRLTVGVDSPEAFEEVFWGTYAARSTRDPDGLRPAGAPDPDVMARYRNWVGRIVARDANGGPPRRYLCKNNNDLLRLPWLRSAFPDVRIVTPFRRPADHVRSLLRQHRRFLARHRDDPFSLEYMDWLGHHEFGRHFLPFKLGPSCVPVNGEDLLEPAYWVGYWTDVYRWLLDHHGEDVIWIDHDRLRVEPGGTLTALEKQLDVREGTLARYAGEIAGPVPTLEDSVDEAVTPACREVYDELRRRAGQ